jgi:hypothetical protein
MIFGQQTSNERLFYLAFSIVPNAKRSLGFADNLSKKKYDIAITRTVNTKTITNCMREIF